MGTEEANDEKHELYVSKNRRNPFQCTALSTKDMITTHKSQPQRLVMYQFGFL